MTNNVENKLFDINDVDEPSYFYGNFDHLMPIIEKARKSLIEVNADTIKFYYRADLIKKEVFLRSTDIDDVYNIADSDISWRAPEIVVSIYDTKVIWIDKYDENNSMWIAIERNYDIPAQYLHDSGTLV